RAAKVIRSVSGPSTGGRRLGNRNERARVSFASDRLRSGMSAISTAPYSGALLTIPLTTGWEMASAKEPALPAALSSLPFIPAQVPGTVASALRAGKAWRMGDEVHFDASEHWFRCRFDADPAESGEEIILRLGGI